MRRHMISAIQLAAGTVVMVAALAGCIFDDRGTPRPRTDGTCYLGGCAAEVCSDRTDVITPCIWRDSFACFHDARCERQADGACGWTQTAELKACLASPDPAPSSP